MSKISTVIVVTFYMLLKLSAIELNNLLVVVKSVFSVFSAILFTTYFSMMFQTTELYPVRKLIIHTCMAQF